MARSVMAETSAFTPAKSASSSRHSQPMMVESMSATSSRLRRCSAGWTQKSMGGVAERVGLDRHDGFRWTASASTIMSIGARAERLGPELEPDPARLATV